jgi:hypothetical protein
MQFMRSALSLAALGLALAAVNAHAADDAKNKQQSKMAVCNKDAGEKKGDERKKFMSECLKAKPAMTAQQEKMKACNLDAKDKKGDERKKFMSECLKKG